MNGKFPAATLHHLLKYQLKYDFRNVPCFDKSAVYLVNEKNRNEAEADIMLLPRIFAAAHKKDPSFPLTHLYSDDIRFIASDALDPHQFCHFELYEKTNDDNTDYILILHFYITLDLRNIIYGDIYYLSDGSIGKYNTVFEHENDIFYIQCKKNGNRLDIQRVNCDKGKRKKRFYPLIKIGTRASYFISGTIVIVSAFLIWAAFYIYDNMKHKDEYTTAGKTVSSYTQPEFLLESFGAEDDNTEPDTEGSYTLSESSRDSETIGFENNADISDLSLISITSPITQGSMAIVKMQGQPETVYSIYVYYSSGISSASGLEDKKTDGSGFVEWSWKIGNQTKKGTYKIEIKGGNQLFTTEITIT